MDEWSGRTKLNFTRRAILTKSETGYTHDTEKEVEPSEEDVKPQTALERDRAKLASRNLSLYDQLQANKEKKEEEWKANHNMFMTQKTIDNEDMVYIKQQQDIKKANEKKRLEQEKSQLAEFAVARASKTKLIASETKKEVTPQTSASNVVKQDLLALNAQQIVLKKKRKSNKLTKSEGETKIEKSAEKPAKKPALSLVDYDDDSSDSD